MLALMRAFLRDHLGHIEFVGFLCCSLALWADANWGPFIVFNAGLSLCLCFCISLGVFFAYLIAAKPLHLPSQKSLRFLITFSPWGFLFMTLASAYVIVTLMMFNLHLQAEVHHLIHSR